MPLHTDKAIDDYSRLIVWEITETVDWFLSMLHLDEEESERYRGFKTDQRRVHWLAYRYVLKNVLKKGDHIRIRYDEHYKPFIDLSDEHISVSHSGKYASVIISRKYRVGIDIEHVHKRLHKVADKFVSEGETGQELHHMATDSLCLHWCSKEALYKLYGERNLDFREHIRIHALPDKLEGVFKARIQKGEHTQNFQMQSAFFDGYCLVYVVDILDK